MWILLVKIVRDNVGSQKHSDAFIFWSCYENPLSSVSTSFRIQKARSCWFHLRLGDIWVSGMPYLRKIHYNRIAVVVFSDGSIKRWVNKQALMWYAGEKSRQFKIRLALNWVCFQISAGTSLERWEREMSSCCGFTIRPSSVNRKNKILNARGNCGHFAALSHGSQARKRRPLYIHKAITRIA